MTKLIVINQLRRGTNLVIETPSAIYHMIVQAPKQGKVKVIGGMHFPEEKEVYIVDGMIKRGEKLRVTWNDSEASLDIVDSVQLSGKKTKRIQDFYEEEYNDRWGEGWWVYELWGKEENIETNHVKREKNESVM